MNTEPGLCWRCHKQWGLKWAGGACQSCYEQEKQHVADTTNEYGMPMNRAERRAAARQNRPRNLSRRTA